MYEQKAVAVAMVAGSDLTELNAALAEGFVVEGHIQLQSAVLVVLGREKPQPKPVPKPKPEKKAKAAE